MLDKIIEFLRQVFSREILDKLIGLLVKIGDYVVQAIEVIKKIIEWLYGGLQDILTRLFG